jgi:hypothetical protein|tara:strand:- start:5261 stop:6403 length:1143 start_codon:yes stop_codon:yes gene_type:complete
MSQIRVNIKHRVNNAAIKREKRNGRDVIVVPSAVAKFDTVLNNIFYPRAELEASYQQLEGLPAPLGHPVVNNQFVSARTPEAINGFWAGAWNTNPRIEGDRVFADKVIDVEFAQNSENGRKLLAAINEGKPISTSTGLLMQREPAPEGADYEWVGNSFAFDHDAILISETPAIGTADGVGMMVNSAGEQVEVVNSELEMDDDLFTMMAWEMVNEYDRAEKRQRNGGLVERIKNAVRAVLNGDKPEEAAGLQTNSQTSTEEPQMTTEELQAMLDKQAETLQANQAQAIASAVSDAVKPLQEKLDAINAEAEAAAEAEKTTLVETVVEAKLATEDEAKALDVNALRIMARNCKAPKGADHPLNGGRLSTNADKLEFEAPEAI